MTTDGIQQLDENILKVMVESCLIGHDLTPFEQIPNGKGYQALCLQCQKKVYVSAQRIMSFLNQEKCLT